ncbi:hemolysin III family protein [Candidatus Parcubacteria bacterium]|nr:hemolysin III family protein [Candidatus Parcubacteria bacterium]
MKIDLNNNEPISSLTHFIGLMLSIAGLVLMIVAAAKHGTAWHVTGFSIFGASLVLLYLASTVYHFIPKTSRLKKIFLRVDLSFIFILIAGTYTPLVLLPLRGPWGWTIFGLVWGLALLGLFIQIFKIRIKSWQAVLLYLFTGWLAVIALPVLWDVFSSASITWLFLGGIFYTVGVLFFSLDKLIPLFRWFGMHEIFHILVMAGSFSHFWLMYRFMVYI